MLGISRKQAVMLAVLTSGTFIAFLNQTLVTPTLPTIMAEMSVDAATVQWLTTGFTLVNAIMIPITAYMTDRFKSRSLFIVAMGIFALGSAVATVAPMFLLLLVGRMVQAAGAGIVMPMVMTIYMLSFPVESRGRALGIFGVIGAFAPAIGPTVSGLVIDHFSWRYVFAAVTVLAVVDIICAAVVLDGKKAQGNKDVHLDKLSVVLSSLGFGAVLYGFSAIGSYGFSALAIVPAVAGAVILVLFFKRQTTLEQPMLKVDILKNRRFLVATIICMVVQAAIMANGVLIPILVQELMGYSATVSGLVILPGAILSGVMGPIAGRIFDKRGPRNMGIMGTVGLVCFTVPFVFVTQTTPLWVLCLLFAMRNVVLSLVNMPINTWGMNALGNDVLNHGTALHNTLRQVAGSFGTAMVVSAYSMVQTTLSPDLGMAQAGILGFNVAFIIQSVLCIAAAVITIVAVKSKPSDVAQADPDGMHSSVLAKIMKWDVYYLTTKDTVADAVKLFVEKNISAAPIVDGRMMAVGMISDGDLIRALGRRNRSYLDPIAMIISTEQANPSLESKLNRVMELPVSAIATMGLISIDYHASFDEACRVLGDNHLKKAPVVHDGKLLGVINRSDVTMYALKMYMETHDAA